MSGWFFDFYVFIVLFSRSVSVDEIYFSSDCKLLAFFYFVLFIFL